MRPIFFIHCFVVVVVGIIFLCPMSDEGKTSSITKDKNRTPSSTMCHIFCAFFVHMPHSAGNKNHPASRFYSFTLVFFADFPPPPRHKTIVVVSAQTTSHRISCTNILSLGCIFPGISVPSENREEKSPFLFFLSLRSGFLQPVWPPLFCSLYSLLFSLHFPYFYSIYTIGVQSTLAVAAEEVS